MTNNNINCHSTCILFDYIRKYPDIHKLFLGQIYMEIKTEHIFVIIVVILILALFFNNGSEKFNEQAPYANPDFGCQLVDNKWDMYTVPSIIKYKPKEDENIEKPNMDAVETPVGYVPGDDNYMDLNNTDIPESPQNIMPSGPYDPRWGEHNCKRERDPIVQPQAGMFPNTNQESIQQLDDFEKELPPEMLKELIDVQNSSVNIKPNQLTAAEMKDESNNKNMLYAAIFFAILVVIWFIK